MARADTAVLRTNARGLRKAEKMLSIDEKYIRQVIQEAIDETGLTGVEVVRQHAPVRLGQLRDSVVIAGRTRSTYRPSIRIGLAGAFSDQGFDYTKASRFGRRAVEAKGRSTMARTYHRGAGLFDIRGGGPTSQVRPFRARMLSFAPGPPGSAGIYRRRVKAYRPKRDWVRSSQAEVKRVADFNFAMVTREIEKVLKGGSASNPRQVGVAIRSRTGKFHT